MPNQGPFDVVPPGKKPEFDPKSGEWKLVDLSAESIEDLQVLYDDALAKLKVASEELSDLREQVKMLQRENAELRKIGKPKK